MNGTRGNAALTARIDVALWVACGCSVWRHCAHVCLCSRGLRKQDKK